MARKFEVSASKQAFRRRAAACWRGGAADWSDESNDGQSTAPRPTRHVCAAPSVDVTAHPLTHVTTVRHRR